MATTIDLHNYLIHIRQKAKESFDYDQQRGLRLLTDGRPTQVEDDFYNILMEDDLLYTIIEGCFPIKTPIYTVYYCHGILEYKIATFSTEDRARKWVLNQKYPSDYDIRT